MGLGPLDYEQRKELERRRELASRKRAEEIEIQDKREMERRKAFSRDLNEMQEKRG